MTNWLFLQLADSAFPTGGFAHSAGLEAALQQGEIEGAAGVEGFLREALWQTGFGALVLATAAHAGDKPLDELDTLCDLFLSSPVANRASRLQGRAFVSTCERSLGVALGQPAPHRHFAPVFGAIVAALALSREEMQRLLLFGTARGIISAAIRLGLFGPYQAQRLQTATAPLLDEVLGRCAQLGLGELAQTAPLLDLFQMNHDRLYSRLFQS